MALMASRYEGLPLVLLDAKSWSLPVVAYDCPTCPQEIINQGLDGFLVPMNDKATSGAHGSACQRRCALLRHESKHKNYRS
nr:amylovoran biosynthesis protein AmsD [Candidatus Pantoea persica]